MMTWAHQMLNSRQLAERAPCYLPSKTILQEEEISEILRSNLLPSGLPWKPQPSRVMVFTDISEGQFQN